MKKGIIWFLCFTLIFTLTGRSVHADEKINVKDLEMSGTGKEEEAHFDSQLSDFINAKEGSFSIRFKPTAITTLTALLSISSTENQNNYFGLWFRSGSVGIEYRDTGGKHIINKQGQNPRLADLQWHTVTLNHSKDGIKVYGDGLLLFEDSTTMSHLDQFNFSSMKVGQLVRANGPNHWPFTGLINDITFTDYAMSEDEISLYHQYTAYDVEEIMEDPKAIFTPGQAGSNNYRIPSLLKTANGSLLAAIDKRNNHSGDWGDIDIALRRSFDNGDTWEDDQVIIDLKTNPNDNSAVNSAFLIDAAMVQDTDPNHEAGGRIFMLVDMFPQGQGFFSAHSDVAQFGTPYLTVDGTKYLGLQNKDGQKFYVTPDGAVHNYDTKEITKYTVTTKSTAGQPFNDLGDLYEDGEYVGNVYLAFSSGTPLRAMSTIYLWLTYSDDDGATWSQPVDLTPQIKEDWMYFMGTGPGTGLKLQNGDLVFPIYTTNKNGGASQSSGLIGSSDGGETWTNYESVNDDRLVGGNIINSETLNNEAHITTEAQVVQLKNGDLKMFSRNKTGKVLVSTSTDNGETWHEVLEQIDVAEEYVQLSAISLERYGSEYVMIASAGGPGRNNGTLKLLLVEEDNKLTLISETPIHKGPYAYNTLQQIDEDRFAVFYENEAYEYNGGNHMQMLFKTFTWDDLFRSITVDYDVEVRDYKVKFTSSNPMVASDKLELLYNGAFVATGKFVNSREYVFETNMKINSIDGFKTGYLEGSDGESIQPANSASIDRLITKFEGLRPNKSEAIVKEFDELIKLYNEYGNVLINGTIASQMRALIDKDESNKFDNTTYDITASHEDAESIYNGSNIGPFKYALDGDESTFWHAKRPAGDETPYSISMKFESKVELQEFHLLPRQDGSSNAQIQSYEIYAHTEAGRILVSQGNWDLNKNLKVATLDKVYSDHYEFVVLSSFSNTVSAAEITLHGSLTSTEVVNTDTLTSLLEGVEAINVDLFSEESLARLNSLVSEIQAKLDNQTLSEDEIAGLESELLALYSSLDPKESTVDLKAKLGTLVEEAKELILESDKYTSESISQLEEALQAAELNAGLSVSNNVFAQVHTQLLESIENLGNAITAVEKVEEVPVDPTDPSDKDETPDTGEDDKPGTDGEDKPGTDGEDKPGTDGEDKPGTDGDDKPATDGDGKPGTDGEDNTDTDDSVDPIDPPSTSGPNDQEQPDKDDSGEVKVETDNKDSDSQLPPTGVTIQSFVGIYALVMMVGAFLLFKRKRMNS